MATQPMLDDAGRPLPAFGFLNAHDAFRRDLPRFERAADRLGRGELDGDALEGLRHHWFVYRTFLEEHHGVEDDHLFPLVAEHEPSCKPVLERLANEHDELHALLPHITTLLEAPGGPDTAALQTAFARLGALVEPHFATEEAELVPVMRAALAAGNAGPPPRHSPPAEAAVPDEYGIPFALEHLDERLRAFALPLFPSQPDPAQVGPWIEAYRARVASWTE